MTHQLASTSFSPNHISEWTHPLAIKIRESYEKSLLGQDDLKDHWKNLQGMSGKKYRSFINSLIKVIPDPRYLEVGSWKGSTACAAISTNNLKATCIDNWSQFGGPKNEFNSNIENCLKESNCNFSMIEEDFRKVDYNTLGKFNVYFFDGPHEEIDQYDGVKCVQNALEDVYILIVDDWNMDIIRRGTLTALKDLNSNILASIEILTDIPGSRDQFSDWHAGYFISLIQK